MVLAADNMGNPVADIIDDIAEQVEWFAVGADDDKIIDFGIVRLRYGREFCHHSREYRYDQEP